MDLYQCWNSPSKVGNQDAYPNQHKEPKHHKVSYHRALYNTVYYLPVDEQVVQLAWLVDMCICTVGLKPKFSSKFAGPAQRK